MTEYLQSLENTNNTKIVTPQIKEVKSVPYKLVYENTTSGKALDTPALAYPKEYYLLNQGCSNPITANKPVQQAVYPQTQGTTAPMQQIVPPSSSGVNITIINPTAGAPNTPITNACTYQNPCFTTQYELKPSTQPTVKVEGQAKEIKQPIPQQKIEALHEDETYKKNVTMVTDNLIKSIESFMKSNDLSLRKDGMKKVVELLSEDPDTRKDDIALKNLVLLGLNDKESSVRIMALSAIDKGLVTQTGDIIERLETIKESSKYPHEQRIAANVLLDGAGKKITIQKKKEHSSAVKD